MGRDELEWCVRQAKEKIVGGVIVDAFIEDGYLGLRVYLPMGGTRKVWILRDESGGAPGAIDIGNFISTTEEGRTND